MTRSRYCDAKKKQGPGTCTRPAGWGTEHVGSGRCKLHGGSTKAHNTAARNEDAKTAAETYGLPRDVAPHQALMEELHRTAGHVAWLELQIRALDDDGLQDDKAWVRLYHAERAHLAKVARTCIDVGIEERRVRIAEQTGEAFAKALSGILGALGVADDPRVPKLVRKHLALLEAPS